MHVSQLLGILGVKVGVKSYSHFEQHHHHRPSWFVHSSPSTIRVLVVVGRLSNEPTAETEHGIFAISSAANTSNRRLQETCAHGGRKLRKQARNH